MKGWKRGDKRKIGRKRFLAGAMCVCMTLCAGCQAAGTQDGGFVRRRESGVVISVLAGQSTSDAGVEDMINETAAEKFPELQIEWECVDWGDKFASQMQGRIASGEIPDLIVGKAQDVVPYAKSGALEPLSIEGIETVEDTALESVSLDGKVYGVPYNAWYQGVLYHKEIFEAYGLKAPETREELEEIVSVLEKNGEVPFASHFQETWNIGNMTMQFMIGDIFGKEDDWGERFRRGETGFLGNDRMRDCFEQNRYILEHSFSDAMMIDQYESDKRFVEGEAAMYLTGAWSLQALEQYGWDGEYGIFPYPNQTGDAALIRETNMTFMIGKNSPYQEEVGRILEELLKNEKLMREILDFTQTDSVVCGIEASGKNDVADDAAYYEARNRIIDATVGNGQLVWSFQNQIAENTRRWLNGEMELEEVFREADNDRDNS